MNKNKLFLAISAALISQSSFALTKQMDFYSNGNRYSVSGDISEFKNITKKDNLLIIDDAKQDAYITLDKKTPYFIAYNEQPLDLNEVLNQHKNENIMIDQREYTLISVQADGILVSSVEKENQYIFIKDPKNITLPQSWLTEKQQGLKAFFDSNVKDTDKLYYSQFENGMNFSNRYQVDLKDDKNLKLTHYIQINNGTNQTYENINVSFFLSDVNVNAARPVMFYKANMAMARGAVAEDMSVDKPEFLNSDIGTIKSVSLDKPITIYPNMNKVKFEEADLKYKEITKFNFNLRNVFPTISNKITDEYVKTESGRDNLVTKVKDMVSQNVLSSSPSSFKDYIVIENKDKLFPAGDLEIFKGDDNARKLIVSDSIRYTENKNIEVLKKSNSDLTFKSIELDSKVIDGKKKIDFDNNENEVILNNILFSISSLTISNSSNNKYIVSFDGKDYTIPEKSDLKIPFKTSK